MTSDPVLVWGSLVQDLWPTHSFHQQVLTDFFFNQSFNSPISSDNISLTVDEFLIVIIFVQILQV